MRSKLFSMTVLVGSLLACGGSSSSSDSSLCSDLQSALDGFSTKAAPCGAQFTSPITGATCNSHLPNCNAADKAALESFATCMKNVPTCSTATVQAWGTQVQSCLSDLQPVSSACGGQ